MKLKKSVAELIQWERVCRVATAGRRGMPHLVPVCHVLHGGKVKNLKENPRITVTVDCYSDAWAGLKGVMVQGRARLIERGPRFRKVRALLYKKYPQYPREAAIAESDSVVIEVTPARVFSWG